MELHMCGHKERHCVQPMVAIAGDAKIIDIFSPYPATDGVQYFHNLMRL
jgi:hypothetical protein